MSPQVSVVIPTYRHCQYILATLNSVFAQTYDNYEIIVVNDGSPDETAQILAPLVAQNKIRYIEQENRGQAAARNRGLEAARGEFIAFLDDDDLWPPDKLEWQVEFLYDQSESVAVGGGVQYVDDSEAPIGAAWCPAISVTFESLFSGSPFVSPGQTLIRTSDLKKIGGLNENLWGVDDFDLWFRLTRCGEISVLPRLSLFYRLHASNASKNKTKMFSNALNLIKIQLLQAPKNKRATLSRNAYQWLYSYIGQNAVHDLRINKFKSSDGAIKNIKILSFFLYRTLNNPALFRSISQDTLPRIFKAKNRAN